MSESFEGPLEGVKCGDFTDYFAREDGVQKDFEKELEQLCQDVCSLVPEELSGLALHLGLSIVTLEETLRTLRSRPHEPIRVEVYPRHLNAAFSHAGCATLDELEEKTDQLAAALSNVFDIEALTGGGSGGDYIAIEIMLAE